MVLQSFGPIFVKLKLGRTKPTPPSTFCFGLALGTGHPNDFDKFWRESRPPPDLRRPQLGFQSLTLGNLQAQKERY